MNDNKYSLKLIKIYVNNKPTLIQKQTINPDLVFKRLVIKHIPPTKLVSNLCMHLE